MNIQIYIETENNSAHCFDFGVDRSEMFLCTIGINKIWTAKSVIMPVVG